MFTKSVVFSSLLALAMGKPIARRNGHIASVNTGFPVVVQGGSFDLSSTTVTQIKTGGEFSFNNFGGLVSLSGFDNFYGHNNFCGVQNVFVQENVVTCRVTEVNIVQQHLAIIAEYAKQVILTQSCESESQVLLFSQWLGNLVNFGQDLRHVNGHVPSYDSHIASQIVNVVDVSGRINVGGFDFAGSSIGSHGVTVLGGNWVDNISPSTVGFVWESAVLAAGHDIPLGVQCSSQVCVAPVIQHVNLPVHETVIETIHHSVEIPVHTTVVELPVHTAPPVVIHQTHETVNTHETINTHETVDSHDSTVVQDGQVSTETISSDVPTATESVILSSERTGNAGEDSGDIKVSLPNEDDAATTSDAETDTTSDVSSTTTDAATTSDTAAASTTDAAGASASDAAAATTTAAAASTTSNAAAAGVSVQDSAAAVLSVATPAASQTVGVRRLPPIIARRAWRSRRRV